MINIKKFLLDNRFLLGNVKLFFNQNYVISYLKQIVYEHLKPIKN